MPNNMNGQPIRGGYVGQNGMQNQQGGMRYPQNGMQNPQGNMQRGTQPASQGTTQMKNSPAYEILAQALFYANKEGTNVVQKKWTPHNMKAFIITRKGVTVKKYFGEEQFVRFPDSVNGLTPNDKEFYTDMLRCLYKLGKGVSAVATNIRDILVFYAESELPSGGEQSTRLGIPKEAAEALYKYSFADSSINPNIAVFSDTAIPSLSKLKECINEGAERLLDTKLDICNQNAIKEVYLTQTGSIEGYDFEWEVHGKKPTAQKTSELREDGTLVSASGYSTFGLDNAHSSFKRIITDTAALNVYSTLNKCSGCSCIVRTEAILSKLNRNKDNYQADKDLYAYLVKNYYRAAKVWQYLKTAAPVNEKTLERSGKINAIKATLLVYWKTMNACYKVYKVGMTEKPFAYMLYGQQDDVLKSKFKPEDIVYKLFNAVRQAKTVEEVQNSVLSILNKATIEEIGSTTPKVYYTTVLMCTLAEVLGLFEYGFRHSRVLTTFLFEDEVEKIKGIGISALPQETIDMLVKQIVSFDTEYAKHYTVEGVVHNAVSTVYKCMGYVPKQEFTALDVRQHLNAIYTIFSDVFKEAK